MAMRCFTAFLMMFQVVLAQQTVNLDKLSNCHLVSTLNAWLHNPVSNACRTPHNAVERRLMSQLHASSTAQACLLLAAPDPSLDGYSCLDLNVGLDREISCFQTVEARAIQEFKQNYDSSGKLLATKYINRASQCAAGNRDAATARNSNF